MEVEAVSQTTSPSTHKPYGVAIVARVWQVPRSTFYAMKARQGRPVTPRAKRGPKTSHSDAELTELIRQEIAASPFHGEGHRKIWARLRIQDISTSQRRVLRLMRESQLLAPSRLPHAPKNEHKGQIITNLPNQVWGTDGTTTVTLKEGKVTVFAAIDHGQRAGIDDQLRLGNGGADARPQSGKVPRQAQDTVRLVAPEIGLDQRVGDEPRVRFRHAGGDVNRR